jgi:hypothetical protein
MTTIPKHAAECPSEHPSSDESVEWLPFIQLATRLRTIGYHWLSHAVLTQGGWHIQLRQAHSDEDLAMQEAAARMILEE